MKPTIGKKYLINCDAWFIAPDGHQYRAVFGTVNNVMTAEETLGVKTNAKSTNWYVSIGNALIAGCQIHYAIQTDMVSIDPGEWESEHNGVVTSGKRSRSLIYMADN